MDFSDVAVAAAAAEVILVICQRHTISIVSHPRQLRCKENQRQRKLEILIRFPLD